MQFLVASIHDVVFEFPINYSLIEKSMQIFFIFMKVIFISGFFCHVIIFCFTHVLILIIKRNFYLITCICRFKVVVSIHNMQCIFIVSFRILNDDYFYSKHRLNVVNNVIFNKSVKSPRNPPSKTDNDIF